MENKTVFRGDGVFIAQLFHTDLYMHSVLFFKGRYAVAFAVQQVQGKFRIAFIGERGWICAFFALLPFGAVEAAG